MKNRILLSILIPFCLCSIAHGKNSWVRRCDFNNDSKIDSIVYMTDTGISKFYISTKNDSYQISTSNFIKDVIETNDLNFELVTVFININKDKRLVYNVEMTGRGGYYEEFNLSFISDQFFLTAMSSEYIDKTDFDVYSSHCEYNLINPLEIVSLNYKTLKKQFNSNHICKDRFLLNNTFESILNHIREVKNIDKPRIPRMDYYFNEYPICRQTVQQYNDMAYYCEKGGNYKESIYILNKVLNQFPKRTVAYINLGDSYWGLKKTQKAHKAYNKYIELMRKSGKESRIPKRVYERMNKAEY